MPWNDNTGGGGGPRGSGGNNGQNPWGQRPSGGGGGGGGQEPPDLDEVVRQMQGQLRGMFGGGGGGGAKDGKGGKGGGIGISLIIIVLIAVWILTPGSGWYQVGPNQNGVVLRFGEYSRTAGPGVHFKFPTPFEQVLLPEVTTTNSITIGGGAAGQMLTRDENIVDIDFAVQWRVDLSYPDGVRDFLFNVRDPNKTVHDVAESAMREVIGTSDLQFIIGQGRGEISQRTEDLVQTTLNEYSAGIRILQINLQTAQAPASVIDAFRDVDVAQQDAERARLEASARANQVIPAARGDAAIMTQAAEAYREAVIARADGEADRFVAVYTEYALAPEVTRRRMYLETMELVLQRSELMVLDSDAGVVPYLPLNELGSGRNQGGN